MLAPRVVIFSASNLLGSSARPVHAVAEGLSELERRNIPLVLSTRGTRAQIELLRRKIEHRHPFITEGGGGVFIPDGYFSLRLEGAVRSGRYFCVPFGRPAHEAIAAIKEIAAEVKAEVVPYAEMTARDIARNTGTNIRDGEASGEREFSEPFFFAGNAESAAPAFAEAARLRNWQIRRSGDEFVELYSGNDEGNAVRYLMKVYREALRSRIRSVGIGSSVDDLRLLLATDQRIVLAVRQGCFDEQLIEKIPNAVKIGESGPAGWDHAVLKVLNRL